MAIKIERTVDYIVDAWNETPNLWHHIVEMIMWNGGVMVKSFVGLLTIYCYLLSVMVKL